MVTGYPLPATITIEKWNIEAGNYEDYPNTKYSINDLRTISIALSLEDSGQYRACVENSHDAIECATFTITVKGNCTSYYCDSNLCTYISQGNPVYQVVYIVVDLIPQCTSTMFTLYMSINLYTY